MRNAAAVLLLGFGACSIQDRDSSASDSITAAIASESTRASAPAENLAAICPGTGQRGSILVARIAPEEEESGISFKLLGDGAGPGVVLCGDDLYADVAALLALMGERGAVTISGATAVIDGKHTAIPAYMNESVIYVAVAPFARSRHALLMRRTDHRMDATIWPRETLLHLKTLGPDRRGLYDSAVRAGLLPE